MAPRISPRYDMNRMAKLPSRYSGLQPNNLLDLGAGSTLPARISGTPDFRPTYGERLLRGRTALLKCV